MPAVSAPKEARLSASARRLSVELVLVCSEQANLDIGVHADHDRRVTSACVSVDDVLPQRRPRPGSFWLPCSIFSWSRVAGRHAAAVVCPAALHCTRRTRRRSRVDLGADTDAGRTCHGGVGAICCVHRAGGCCAGADHAGASESRQRASFEPAACGVDGGAGVPEFGDAPCGHLQRTHGANHRQRRRHCGGERRTRVCQPRLFSLQSGRGARAGPSVPSLRLPWVCCTGNLGRGRS